MAKVIKALRVERDLEEIWDYIAADNPSAAEHCLRRLDAQFQNLAAHPLIGRERNDLASGLRSFPVGNYIIFYQPMADKTGVQIVRVTEGHQNITPEDFGLTT
jgi:toxin ParE1/3/4